MSIGIRDMRVTLQIEKEDREMFVNIFVEENEDGTLSVHSESRDGEVDESILNCPFKTVGADNEFIERFLDDYYHDDRVAEFLDCEKVLDEDEEDGAELSEEEIEDVRVYKSVLEGILLKEAFDNFKAAVTRNPEQ